MALIGVDEAGRGPVLGSLFVGAVAVHDRTVLPDGVADSKTLSPDTRSRLAEAIEVSDDITSTVVELTADEIDQSEQSLTELVARGFASAIDQLADEGTRAMVDTGEADTDRFTGRIERYLTTSIEVEAAIGADEFDPLVSAASIVAKEAREAHVAHLASEFGEIGSGYPSDPTTRRFIADYLEDHRELPTCARASWATSQDALAALEQAGLDEFSDHR